MLEIIKIPVFENAPKWQSSSPTPINHIKMIHNYIDDYEEYNYIPELDKLLNKKSVAYVGPSPHLKGLKMGNYIDSHDIVIRINQHSHIEQDDWEDYGKRTDILVACLNIHNRQDLLNNKKFVDSLQYVICPMINMNTLPEVNSFLNNLNIPTHNVNDGYLLKLYEQVGTICNTGFGGLVTLLNYNLKKLYITGVTFYNMNSFGLVYNNNYIKNFCGNNPNQQPSRRDVREDIHKQQPQIDYFKKILKYHYPQTIELDNYLIKNFINTSKQLFDSV